MEVKQTFSARNRSHLQHEVTYPPIKRALIERGTSADKHTAMPKYKIILDQN